jgi:outer membrane protein OmpA-like peptidoglycan-associated protein
MFRYIVILFLALIIPALAYAGEHGFETTSEGIVNALSRPASQQPVQTRGLTRAFNPRTRGIKVVMKEKGKTVEETVVVSDTPAPHSVNLKIEFDTDSYALRPDSFRLLNELGRALISETIKDKDIILKGHTDSDGTDEYNRILSLNRSMSVWSYLADNFDIDPNRIRVVGYGESMPLVPNSSATNKQLNRRVEVQAAQ